jgi:hypothetical protein
MEERQERKRKEPETLVFSPFFHSDATGYARRRCAVVDPYQASVAL